MPTNTLTDARLRKVQPGEKPVKLFDGGGLHLYVSPKGGRAWRLAYRVSGKPKTMSFGLYPEVSLAEARRRRDEARALLRDGIDPMQERKKQDVERRHVITLDEATEAYWGGRSDLSADYVMNARRAIQMHLSPLLGAKPINQIDRGMLLEALNTMDAKGLHVYVRKTRMWIGQVFDWAVEQAYTQHNPAKDINPAKAFGKHKERHFASVDLGELPAFMLRLSGEGDIASVLACRLLALTWLRTAEVRFGKWTEIQGDTWSIPEERMKMSRDHVVPLSRQAIDLLAELKKRSGPSPYILPAYHRTDRPISENTILTLIARIGYKGKMTGHGFRSVACTWANELGWKSDVIERQLAHVERNEVRSAYNRAEYLDSRRSMLQDWADFLDKITAR